MDLVSVNKCPNGVHKEGGLDQGVKVPGTRHNSNFAGLQPSLEAIARRQAEGIFAIDG
jgi:hypothetical protein